MADEVPKKTANYRRVIAGVTDDSNLFVTMLRVDPTTLRLKTTTIVDTGVIDDESVDAAQTGNLIMGSDGSKYQVINVVTRHDRTSLYVAEGFAATSTMHLDTATDSTLKAFMLVDISDTSNWKHTETDHIIIRHILIEADPDASWVGEVKIGFLSNVNGTDGDFNQIIDIDMRRKTALVIEDLAFTGGFHCQSSTHFGPIIADSTLFQTDVDLIGPDGGVAAYSSGNGDLAMIIDGDGTNFIDVSITMTYETVGA